MVAGASIAIRTRSGNSAKPDRTWSDWSEPLTDAGGSRITSPNARYIQWKVEMTGKAGSTPVLDSVTLAYLPQNNAPVVKSINVINSATPSLQASKAAAGSSASAYTVTVSDTGDSGPSTSGGTPTQTLARSSKEQTTVAWQAEDIDGDQLVYNLYFRGEDETQWKLLKGQLHEASFTFDAGALADGKYFFKVTASDREANPPSSAREAELISSPVLVDNTPPVVTVGTVRRNGAEARIEFEAADSASPLRRAEYSLNADSWIPVESADGVVDSPREKFTLELKGLNPGEQLVSIRAVDSAGNTGVAKVVLK
jgi:hypothetical protein